MVCVVSAGGVCDGVCVAVRRCVMVCVCRQEVCVMVCVVSAGGVCDGLCCVGRRVCDGLCCCRRCV